MSSFFISFISFYYSCFIHIYFGAITIKIITLQQKNYCTITMLTRILNRSFCIFFLFCSWPNATYNNEVHGSKNIFGYHTDSNVYDFVRHCAGLNKSIELLCLMEVCTELSLSFFFFFYLFFCMTTTTLK